MHFKSGSVLASIAAVVCLGTNAFGQTITVTTSEDTVDFGGAQQVGNLPGPDGVVSLREAVTAANNTPGPQTIGFAIPQSEWWAVLPNQATCLIDDALHLTDPGTTIDFTTQTAVTGDTNPNGWEVAVYFVGPPTGISPFMVFTDACTFKGMDYVGGNALGPSVTFYGSNNRVISSTDGSVMIETYDWEGPPVFGNVIGGTQPGEGNRLYSVEITGRARDNTVIGNVMQFVSITGDQYRGTCDNNRIGGPSDAERNVISGNGKVGEEGFPYGTQVNIAYAVNTVVENNYVGTTEDGMAKWPFRNGTEGIAVGRACTNTLVKNNLVSGIERTGSNHYAGQRFGIAIVVDENATGTRLIGNRVGLNAAGTGTILNVSGVAFARGINGGLPANTVFGTTAPGEGNTVTASERYGLTVWGQVSGVRISGNSIYDNGTLGIDLLDLATGSPGVTANDPGDPDAGGNGLQNFPVITGAVAAGGSVTVEGTFNSLPNQSFTLEFFASPACDPSGFGEGRDFLGSTTVVTDASGNAAFAATLPANANPGSFVTATAIHDATGNTSEFSACAPLAGGGGNCMADYNGDGFVDGIDYDQFNNDFEAGDMSADVNGDGFVDGIDYDQFNNAFEAGC